MNNNNNEMKSNVFSDYGNSNNVNNGVNPGTAPANNATAVNGVPNQANINQIGKTPNNMGQMPNNGMNNSVNNMANNAMGGTNQQQAQNMANNQSMPSTPQPNNQISNTQTTSSIMGTPNQTIPGSTNTYFQNIPDNQDTKTHQPTNQTSANQIPVNQDLTMPKLNTDETVGTMKKDTQKSPVAMLVLFACLIIGIFVIPYITPYLSDVLKIFGIDDNSSIYGDGNNDSTNDTTPSKDNNTNKDNTSNDDSKDTTYYDILDTTSITFDKLTIANLTKTEENGSYYLSYKITNNDTSSYNFRTHKIYFDLYNDSKTYIGRVLIDTDTLNSKEEITLKSILNNTEYTGATKLEVLERTTADYQSVTLKNNKLTCTGNNHSTIYTFSSNKLTGIDDTYNYSFTVNDDTYASYALSVQNTVNDLNKATGVSAGFVNTQTGFTKTMKINYSETSEDFTKYDRIYYGKDVSASTVKYELESIGYKCD